MLSVLQGVDSVWELDEIRALIARAEELCDARYGSDERRDVSLRIVAEHARTATFLVSDGVIPSNEDRGYVLRRIIRRAVRHAYLLGVNAEVMASMVDEVVGLMAEDYPDLGVHHQSIRDVVAREEQGFRQTLRTGLALLDEELDGVGPGGVLAGSVAFKLHDTFGFPFEVTREVVAERGVDIDEAGFEVEMAGQRRRAKDARKDAGPTEHVSAYADLAERHGTTVFTGRDEDTTAATVLGVIGDTVVLDRTPFYAESGGQIGDTGTLETDGVRLDVVDTTFAVPGLVRHLVSAGSPGLGSLEPGSHVVARIDVERRAGIRRHHTATHVLHWALRTVLGDHVKQQGSWVGPDRLRFDFSHFQALTGDEIREIEDLANVEILGNGVCRHYETTKSEALAAGAIAFFGDKYGDLVRVLEAGKHSVELCGGTHVGALGDIGPVKIVSETSIGSNIRRLEAVAGIGPIGLLRDAEQRLESAADAIGVPVGDLLEGIRKRGDEARSLKDEVRALRRQVARSAAGDLASAAIDGALVARVEVEDRDEIRDLALSLRDSPGMRAVVLAASPGGKGVALVAAVAADSGLDAGALIADAVKLVGGGGGKGAEVATAGGKRPEGIDDALDDVRGKLGLTTRT